MAETMTKHGADVEAIVADLTLFTRRWGELGEPCWLELRTFGEHLTPQNSKWRVEPDELLEAAHWAAVMNALQRNVYAVRNPIRDACGPSAKDADILAAFYLWADCDDDASAGNIRTFTDAKVSAVVRTGSVPGERVHTYWELAEPIRDLAAWRRVQEAIAARFQSDESVVNASRIMRVAGTVCWPDSRKQARGYVPETARMILPQTPRDPMPFERAARIWPAAQPDLARSPVSGLAAQAMGAPTAPSVPANASSVHFATAAAGPARRTDEELRDALRRCSIDGEKHTGVRDLSAMLAARGADRVAVEFIVRSVCPVWDRNVEDLIDSAFRKFAPVAQHANFDHKPAAAGDAQETWRVQSAAEFTAGFVAPEWLVQGVIQRGRLYTLTAPTGHAKTATMLYVGAQISQGADVCGLPTEQGDVLFLAGENPDDVRARTIIALDRYGIDPFKARLHFIPGTFSIRADMERLTIAAAAMPDLALVVVDTFAAYFDGDDENSNAQALDFARLVRGLTNLPSRPAVVMPAHPVKNAGRANLTPKGGSSLLNEVDGNLTVWKEDAVATLHWQGKIRGPEFEPIQLEIVTATHDRVKDKRGVLMPSVLALPVPPARARELAREAISREDAVLLNVATFPLKSVAERCADLGGPFMNLGGANKSSMQRVLAKLETAKLIRTIGDKRERRLTSDGEAVVERLRRGERSVSDDS